MASSRKAAAEAGELTMRVAEAERAVEELEREREVLAAKNAHLQASNGEFRRERDGLAHAARQRRAPWWGNWSATGSTCRRASRPPKAGSRPLQGACDPQTHQYGPCAAGVGARGGGGGGKSQVQGRSAEAGAGSGREGRAAAERERAEERARECEAGREEMRGAWDSAVQRSKEVEAELEGVKRQLAEVEKERDALRRHGHGHGALGTGTGRGRGRPRRP